MNKAGLVLVLVWMTAIFSACKTRVTIEDPNQEALTIIDDGQNDLTYATIDARILRPRCLSCHGARSASPLDTYPAVIARLEAVRQRTVVEKSMPPQNPLSSDLIQLLAEWIRIGAPLGPPAPKPSPSASASPSPSPSASPSVSPSPSPSASPSPSPSASPSPSPTTGAGVPGFAEIHEKVFKPSCVSCHGAGARVDLTQYSKTVPHLDRIRATAVVDKTMPLAPSAPLTQAQIQLLKTWLDGGAPELGTSPSPSPSPSVSPSPSPSPSVSPSPPGLSLAPAPAARRLSRSEMDLTLQELLGGETAALATTWLQPDSTVPFDNESASKVASGPFIEGIESLAIDAAKRLLADARRKAQVIGCSPTGPGDSACLREFIRKFGRRALRRPLTPTEVEKFATVARGFAKTSFDGAVDVLVRLFMQHPEFIYRFESPQTKPGTVKLNEYEIASRLSFFLWGRGPNDWLLDQAAAGKLTSASSRATVTATMLADPKAAAQVRRFHSLWFGYAYLPHSASLNASMQAEANALVSRVVFEKKSSWFELLKSKESYMDKAVADLYGIRITGAAKWMPLPKDRQGLLSMPAFLSEVPKFGDTSPTQRGKLIREHLLCQNIPPPPPNVNVDQPPTAPGSNCKWDRYAAHRNNPSCAGCHKLTDMVGFGLENYDQLGRYRTYDLVQGRPDSKCRISGQGEFTGVAKFEGPVGLSEHLAQGEEFERCLASRVYEFAAGRKPATDDEAFLSRLRGAAKPGGYKFLDVLNFVISSDEFIHRAEGL